MKFYLAREGVAFGPYTEFQVRESVRLGIFESNDLALAEDGKEWLEVAQLLPANGAPRERQPVPAEDAKAAPVQTLVLPVHGAAPRTRQPDHPVTAPVSEYHLREHETYFAELPTAAFATEFSRGKRTVAAASIAVAAVCLLTLAALLHHRKAAAQDAPSRLSRSTARVEPAAKLDPQLRPVSLPVNNPSPGRALPPAPPEPAAAPAAPEAAAPVSVGPAAAGQPGSGRIEGHMLISTGSGLDFEPPAVEVRLYPLAQLKPYLEQRGSEASARFEELKSRIAAAEAEKERMRKASDAAFDAYTQAEPGSPDRAALEQASAEAKKAREKATNAYYTLMQDREDLLSGAFYLENLPRTAAITQTDSQGRFSFEVPADGDFAVVAGVQRSEHDSTQRYYWFIPVSVTGEPTKMVLLSNNNLSSQGSADSLVLTID